MDPLGPDIRSELARYGPQAGMAELVERWPEVVGDAIARNAWPARIARDGTLHIATADSIWAFELGHRGAEIATRLGVAKVRFAPGPLPSEEAVSTPAKPVLPTPEHERRASEIAASIDDDKLRESVQKAIGLSLARIAKDRPF
jgi:hypothetical protein